MDRLLRLFNKKRLLRSNLSAAVALAAVLVLTLPASAQPPLPGDPTGIPISGLEIASLLGLAGSVYILNKSRNR